MEPVFHPWPKIARLNRDVVITEKLDGTNAAIGIVEYQFGYHSGPEFDGKRDFLGLVMGTEVDDGGLPLKEYRVYAQSRTRIISPGKATDNMGFAAWVEDNKAALCLLGPGLHFGEWWGKGIQRNYGLDERRFSLFNHSRWTFGPNAEILAKIQETVPGIGIVPVLYVGPWVTLQTDRPLGLDEGTTLSYNGFAPVDVLNKLKRTGSVAAPGFMSPEGIVVYHKASGTILKALCEGDELPKGVQVGGERETT